MCLSVYYQCVWSVELTHIWKVLQMWIKIITVIEIPTDPCAGYHHIPDIWQDFIQLWFSDCIHYSSWTSKIVRVLEVLWTNIVNWHLNVLFIERHMVTSLKRVQYFIHFDPVNLFFRIMQTKLGNLQMHVSNDLTIIKCWR